MNKIPYTPERVCTEMIDLFATISASDKRRNLIIFLRTEELGYDKGRTRGHISGYNSPDKNPGKMPI